MWVFQKIVKEKFIKIDELYKEVIFGQYIKHNKWMGENHNDNKYILLLSRGNIVKRWMN